MNSAGPSSARRAATLAASRVDRASPGDARSPPAASPSTLTRFSSGTVAVVSPGNTAGDSAAGGDVSLGVGEHELERAVAAHRRADHGPPRRVGAVGGDEVGRKLVGDDGLPGRSARPVDVEAALRRRAGAADDDRRQLAARPQRLDRRRVEVEGGGRRHRPVQQQQHRQPVAAAGRRQHPHLHRRADGCRLERRHPRSCHVHTHASLPSASASTQNGTGAGVADQRAAGGEGGGDACLGGVVGDGDVDVDPVALRSRARPSAGTRSWVRSAAGRRG